MKNRELIFVVLFCLLFTCISCSKTSNENNLLSGMDLKFNSNGKFKIVQFTDIHWKNGTDNCAETLEILATVLDAENPDLVVFTGDIAISDTQQVAYDAVSKLVVDRKIPWALVIGNHDHEHDMERKDIIPYLQQKPYFLGCNGPDNVFGYGNYILPVKSSQSNTTVANLYFFDSNSYVKDKKYGYYDWIHFSQIQWYREQSKKLTKENNSKPLSSLAFFHIPLPEYDELYNTGNVVGEKNESVCSPKVNSGLFCSFIEMQDVMGVFCGHDYDDNYIGTLRDISLAYGAVSGLDAYGDFDRGGRVIELTEGERKFDTWIRDIHGKKLLFHYPNNDLYPTENTVFQTSYEHKSAESLQQGIKFKYYERFFVSAKDILVHKPKKSGVLKNFSLSPAEIEEHFGFEFETYVDIAEKGIYRFSTTSDDGTIFYLDEIEVINDDGSHSQHEKSATIALEKGLHKINILHFNDIGSGKFEIGIAGLNMEFKTIPDSMLFY